MHSPCFVFLVHFALWLPFYTFCRASRPATRRPLLKKGSIRKLFLRTDNILFMEGRRIRNAGTVDFREPIYGHRAPLLPGHFSQGFPPCNPATPFSKGVDSKTFSVDGQHTFYGRVKNPECRNNGFPGTDLWIPCAVPSVGVLCSRAWWEASSESPWVFDDASRLHDLKRPSLFRRDEVLSRNAHRPFGFAFTHREKFLRVPRGVFSKTLLGREWDSVPQKESERAQRGAPFQAGQGPFTKHPQTVRLGLHEPKKVFEGSKGRFFKNAPWQGVGRSPTKGEGEPAIGARLFRRDKDTQGREGGYYTFSFSQRSLSGFTTAE